MVKNPFDITAKLFTQAADLATTTAMLSEQLFLSLELIKGKPGQFQKRELYNVEGVLKTLPCQMQGSCNGLVATGKAENSLYPEMTLCTCSRARKWLLSPIPSSLLSYPWERFRRELTQSKSLSAWHEVGSPDNGIAALWSWLVKRLAFSFKTETATALSDIYVPTRDQKIAPYIENLLLLQHLFSSQHHWVVDWDWLRPTYLTALGVSAKDEIDRAELSQCLREKALIILYMADHKFRTKAGSNSEMGAFEAFVHELSEYGVGLCVISTQALLPEKQKSLLDFDYSQDMRTTYRDAQNKLRFSSKRIQERGPESIQDCMRAGSFDRLVECLAVGEKSLEAFEAKLGRTQP